MSTKPTIGLAMIVRDEATVITQCLERALPLIDTWTIIDTGSEDETVEIIKRALDGVPGQMHHRDWVGHSHNRTELLELARDTADHLLLLDADLLLTIDGDLPTLTSDMYVARLDGDFSHTLPLLVNGHREGWRYEGAAHAVLTAPGPFSVEELQNARLTETRGSSPRSDKIQRDAQALEQEIDPRTIFYLAQSYRDLGYDEAAADLYRLRVRHSSTHPQEVFWACYQEGLLRIQSDFARGCAILLEAWERRPSRAEPLWKLAREHRLLGQAHPALLYAEQACRIPQPNDNHFVLTWIYQWGCLMERALARQATGDTDGATRDFLQLAERDDEAGAFAREQLGQEAAA